MKREELRRVKIVSHLESFEGFFHGWTEHRNDDIEGKEFICKLGVIETLDGNIVVRNPENIQFLN